MDNIYSGLLARPDVDFQALRDGRTSPLAHFDVDLSTARSIAAGTQYIVEVAGDALICDMDPVNQGFAIVHVQDTALTARTAPVYVTPGSIIKAPFTRLMIENSAQPGMRLRVFYGVGIDFQAGAGANVTVSGNVSILDTVGSGNTHNNSVPTAAVGTNVTAIIAPGANTGGILLKGVGGIAYTGALANSSVDARLIASDTAPASGATKATAIQLARLNCATATAAAARDSFQIFNMSRKLPPAWGLWAVVTAAISAASVEFDTEYQLL